MKTENVLPQGHDVFKPELHRLENKYPQLPVFVASDVWLSYILHSCHFLFLPWGEGILGVQFSFSYPLPKHHLNLFTYGPIKTHTKHASAVLASGHPLWHHYSHLLFRPTYYFPCYKPYFWCRHFCYYISMLQSPRLRKSDILSFNLTFLCHVSWNHSFLPIPTDNVPSGLCPLWSLSIAPTLKELHKDWFLLSGLLAFSPFQITQHLSIFSPAILLAFPFCCIRELRQLTFMYLLGKSTFLMQAFHSKVTSLFTTPKYWFLYMDPTFCLFFFLFFFLIRELWHNFISVTVNFYEPKLNLNFFPFHKLSYFHRTVFITLYLTI